MVYNKLKRLNESDFKKMLFVRSDVIDIINALLECGVDVNMKDENGTTALMEAAGSHSPRSLEIIKVLLDAGADINAKDNDGRTALLYAEDYHNSSEVIDCLLRAGATSKGKDDIKKSEVQ